MNPDGPTTLWIVMASVLTVLLLVCLAVPASLPVSTVLIACWLLVVAWLAGRE